MKDNEEVGLIGMSQVKFYDAKICKPADGDFVDLWVKDANDEEYRISYCMYDLDEKAWRGPQRYEDEDGDFLPPEITPLYFSSIPILDKNGL